MPHRLFLVFAFSLLFSPLAATAAEPGDCGSLFSEEQPGSVTETPFHLAFERGKLKIYLSDVSLVPLPANETRFYVQLGGKTVSTGSLSGEFLGLQAMTVDDRGRIAKGTLTTYYALFSTEHATVLQHDELQENVQFVMSTGTDPSHPFSPRSHMLNLRRRDAPRHFLKPSEREHPVLMTIAGGQHMALFKLTSLEEPTENEDSDSDLYQLWDLPSRIRGEFMTQVQESMGSRGGVVFRPVHISWSGTEVNAFKFTPDGVTDISLGDFNEHLNPMESIISVVPAKTQTELRNGGIINRSFNGFVVVTKRRLLLYRFDPNRGFFINSQIHINLRDIEQVESELSRDAAFEYDLVTATTVLTLTGFDLTNRHEVQRIYRLVNGGLKSVGRRR